MPLFYQHNINHFTKLAIWKIEEDESFFLSAVPPNPDVTHPHKRLQHLAGRYILPYLFDDFPLSEILRADTRKPFLPNEKYHFSISHCARYAAAIVSRNKRVGIDIETISAKIERVQYKFLSDQEHAAAVNAYGSRETTHAIDLSLLASLWSAKEATFKWYGEGKVDFKEHMIWSGRIEKLQDQWICFPFTFDKGSPQHLDVYSILFEDLVLSWVMS
ncbi:MAG: 4'-phosphopantetheinyl transferase superfamily protein [Chitinophagaceae bacterium]|nr:4'-phosphopantetheinyl transferase superfamily protein [Chitinophagaceae bacterium]